MTKIHYCIENRVPVKRTNTYVRKVKKKSQSRQLSGNDAMQSEIKVQVGKDQEKAQSDKDSHSKNRVGKKPN